MNSSTPLMRNVVFHVFGVFSFLFNLLLMFNFMHLYDFDVHRKFQISNLIRGNFTLPSQHTGFS